MKNKCLSLLLCAALIFTMMATPAVQPPAHAEVVAASVTVVAVAITLLAAAGVTWAFVTEAQKSSNQFLSDRPEAKQIIDDIISANPVVGAFVITKAVLPKVKRFMEIALEYFKGKVAVQVPSDTFEMTGNIKLTTLSIDKLNSYDAVYACCPYNMDDIINGKLDLHFVSTTGDTYSIRYTQSFALGFYKNGASTIDKFNDFYHRVSDYYDYISYPTSSPGPSGGNYTLKERKLGFRLSTFNGCVCLFPFICASYVYQEGENVATRCIRNYYEVPADASFYRFMVCGVCAPVSDSIATDTIGIDIDDVNEAIAHGVGQAAEGIQADIQKVIDAINQAVAGATSITKVEAQEMLGIRDYIEALEAAQERTIDAIKEGTREDDMNVPQLPATITDKFPFCVPFDLIAIVKKLNADPTPPSFSIPLRFEALNYTYNAGVDCSGDNWDKVGQVFRWGNTLLFIAGLILITRKLIKG